MVFSVFNYGSKLYDYYETPERGGTHAPAAPIRGRTELGATPEQAAWRLPMGARKVGSGELPQGRVATTGGGSVLGDVIPTDPVKLGALAVLGYFAWRHFR